MTLNTWAALRAFGGSIPGVRMALDKRLKDLPEFSSQFREHFLGLYKWTQERSFADYVGIYVFFLMVIQFILFIYEHLYDWLGLRCIP